MTASTILSLNSPDVVEKNDGYAIRTYTKFEEKILKPGEAVELCLQQKLPCLCPEQEGKILEQNFINIFFSKLPENTGKHFKKKIGLDFKLKTLNYNIKWQFQVPKKVKEFFS